MGPYIVGFDTLAYYVPNTLTWLRDGVNFWSFIATAPFLYVLLMAVTSTGVPIVITLKVMPPLLLGFLGLAVYFYANKTLTWSSKKSLLAVLFATLYFVALRASWDMLRVELGLIFLFTALIFLRKEGNTFKNGIILALATLSVVFAHQLVTVIMFAMIIATIIRLFLDNEVVKIRGIVLCAAPALFLFFLIVYANFVYSPFSVVNSLIGQDTSGIIALLGFRSYVDLIANTLGFLAFCFLPLVPLVVFGTKRLKANLQLKAWVFLILILELSVIIIPNALFTVFPYRWTLLLTFPLAFYAAEGFWIIKWRLFKLGMGLIMVILTVSFMVLPNLNALSYYNIFPAYIPKSMLQNTVPLSDCKDTVNALQWARKNMPSNAHLLVHDAFYGWAFLTFDGTQLIPYGFDAPEAVARELAANGSVYPLYLVWWINGSGWYGQPTVSSAFKLVYQSGKIAIFTYIY
ncbi:hypothetical protein G4O51_01025 [Candidatus Bathyarchaeota archaeon A05DMB-2]|jgi:hypothetical protein|nr:hypothetical protein [Candidatus Bathyarchaeota archaeon A05DMB-2]